MMAGLPNGGGAAPPEKHSSSVQMPLVPAAREEPPFQADQDLVPTRMIMPIPISIPATGPEPALTPPPTCTPDAGRYYFVGRTMALKMPDGRELQATVTHGYSISSAPVMAVQVIGLKDHSNAVLKLFDRLFGSHRELHPLSPEAEDAWLKCVRSGVAEAWIICQQAHHDERVAQRMKSSEEEEDEEGNKAESSHSSAEEDEESELQEDEGYVYAYGVVQPYQDELRAYSQLRELQGQCVPRLISPVTLESESHPADLPSKFFDIQGILLEPVDGFPLTRLHLELPDQPRLWERIVRQAMTTVKHINRAGVVNWDEGASNILASRIGSGSKFRIFFVDFSQSSVKEDYKDTEDESVEGGWAREVQCQENHEGVRVVMTQRLARKTGHILRIPYDADAEEDSDGEEEEGRDERS